MAALDTFNSWLGENVVTIIQALVALGTLSLAGITFYQHRTSLRRELADIVYGPLHWKVSSMQEPSSAAIGSFGEEWEAIKKEHPYLSHRVPKRLFQSFEDLADSNKRINRGLYGRAQNIATESIDHVIKTMAPEEVAKRQGRGELWLRGRNVGPHPVWPILRWLDGESLQHFVERKNPENEGDWHVETMFSGFEVSRDLTTAKSVLRSVFKALDSSTAACKLKSETADSAALSKKILPILERKLRGFKIGTQKPSRLILIDRD